MLEESAGEISVWAFDEGYPYDTLVAQWAGEVLRLEMPGEFAAEYRFGAPVPAPENARWLFLPEQRMTEPHSEFCRRAFGPRYEPVSWTFVRGLWQEGERDEVRDILEQGPWVELQGDDGSWVVGRPTRLALGTDLGRTGDLPYTLKWTGPAVRGEHPLAASTGTIPATLP